MPRARLGATQLKSPLILGPKTDVTASNYTAVASDHYIRVNSGPSNVTLPSASKGTAVNGQRIALVSFDAAGNLVQVLADSGDDIEGGPVFTLGFYGAHMELEARIVPGSTATHWLLVSTNGRGVQTFPIQPTLAAGAQGPLDLGGIIIPQGPRYLASIWAACDAALTGGSLTVTVHGLFADPTTLTISNGFANNGVLYNPGNANRITVPKANGGPALLTASVSTIAGFGGATRIYAGVDLWS